MILGTLNNMNSRTDTINIIPQRIAAPINMYL